MQNTIPQAAKTPLTTPAIGERARMARCGVCWAEPGDACATPAATCLGCTWGGSPGPGARA